jgi:subtilase family serine protease
LAALEAGRVDPTKRLSGMSLLFGMSPVQRALRNHLVAAVQNPVSPDYHRWLSPDDYAAQFGASSADIDRAAAWLRSHGLSVDGPSRTATRLAFSGTVAQVEQAFQTQMHHYRIDGETHFAMSQAPSVPAELAAVVVGLHGMHDFRPQAPSNRLVPQYALPVPAPDGGTTNFPVLAPADFAQIYDVHSLYAANITGSGQTIAIAGQSDFNDADIAAFRATFGLPASVPQRTLVPGSGSAYTTLELIEAEIDLEWAGAVAPDATLRYVFTGDAPNVNALDALVYAIEQRSARVISLSYGRCEEWFTPDDAAFEAGYGDIAALEGVSVVVAGGDTGAAACDGQSSLTAVRGKIVLFPASVPSFVVVGGTQFELTSSNQSMYLSGQLDAVSYIPEAAWNETLLDIDAGYGGLGAGGGGVSRLFAKPYWQVARTPNDGFRDVPDLALSGSADTLPYAVSMSWTAADGDAQAPQPEALTAYGGTSLGAPAFAGVLALLNQAVSAAAPGASAGLGNPNPILYALAQNPAFGPAFHDITTGDNIVPCAPGSPDCPSTPPYQFGYAAGPGYDQATGLGSIDAANLVSAWTGLTPTSTTLQVTQSGTAAGSALELTANIQSKATSNQMTGFVTFTFTSQAPGGAGISGTLGVVPLTPGTSGTESATAILSTSAPGDLNGTGANVAAYYGGDVHYLGSWSASSSVSGTSTLVICPASVTLAPGQTGFAFATAGGSPPVQWGIHSDQTCAKTSHAVACSSIDGGVFTAGPTAGSATVVVMDQFGSYAAAEVTVTDAGVDGALTPPAIGPCGTDAGADASLDAAQEDSGAELEGAADAADTGASEQSPRSGGGCACEIASTGQPPLPTALRFAGSSLVFAAAARRRHEARRLRRQR